MVSLFCDPVLNIENSVSPNRRAIDTQNPRVKKARIVYPKLRPKWLLRYDRDPTTEGCINLRSAVPARVLTPYLKSGRAASGIRGGASITRFAYTYDLRR